MTDGSKIQYYSGYNTYKNQGVRSATVTVSGSLAAGGLKSYSTAVALLANYKYSTGLVKTNDFASSPAGTPRWQPFPPANTYTVPCSGGFGTELTVQLELLIDTGSVTFRATAFNNDSSTITFTSTDISFVYSVHTTAI